jgi:hypothetical protein
MKLKALVAAALFALGMVTAVAIAQPPPGSRAEAKLAAKAAKQRASELKCRGGHMNLGGTVASIDLSSSEFAMDVAKANKKGRDHVGQTATIVVGEKTKMKPKAKSSLDKLAVGDRVGTLIRMCRDAEGDAALMAKHVVVKGHKGGDDEEDTSASTSTSTETTTESTTETTPTTTPTSP